MTTQSPSLSRAPAIATAFDAGDLRMRSVAIASAIAIFGGVCYSLSPATAWLLVVLALVVSWAAIGVHGRERRVLLGVLGCSIALRLVAIVVLAWRVDPQAASFTTVFGDGVYAIRRALWIRNVFASVPIAPPDFIEAFDPGYGQSGYNVALAWFQTLLAPAPFGAHVLSVLLYLLGAIALYRVARAAYGREASLVGLTIVLFMPTLFVWSISPLKESVYFCLTALAAVAAPFYALRGTRLMLRIGCVVAVPILLAGVDALRAGGFAIASGGLAAGLAIALLLRSKRATLCALVAAPLVLVAAATRPSVQDQFLALARTSADRHVGHVRTPGESYKVLDWDFYFGDRNVRTSLTLAEGVRYMAASAVAFVLEPRPWAPGKMSDLAMAPQQIVWYGLALLAPVGVLIGLRRDPLATALLACNALVGAAVIAPNSGNIGTLIRHRDMIVPFVIWLSSLGVVSLCSPRRPDGIEDQVNGSH
jgi:hypothetical protein